ncbi:MAG: DUF169 domain-containing protein, partial [Promethearchaeota archaeon]
MNENLKKYQEFGKKFEELLRPSTFPIAIRLIKNESELANDYKRPKPDLKVQTFICQIFKMVRSYGWTMAITEEDCVCKFARGIYGWDP